MDKYNIINGKVRCTKIKDGSDDFTVGRLYEVRDRRVIANDGFSYAPCTCSNAVRWLEPYVEFELVEDYDQPKDIKQVIFNDPATIILWHDGTKTVAKCCDGDKYDAEKGFCIAYLKKMIGAKQFSEELHKWVKEEKPYKTKPPFNVGDEVKIVNHHLWYWNNDGRMDEWIGHTLTIDHITPWGSYVMKECPQWFWSESSFVQD